MPAHLWTMYAMIDPDESGFANRGGCGTMAMYEALVIVSYLVGFMALLAYCICRACVGAAISHGMIGNDSISTHGACVG